MSSGFFIPLHQDILITPLFLLSPLVSIQEDNHSSHTHCHDPETYFVSLHNVHKGRGSFLGRAILTNMAITPITLMSSSYVFPD